MHSFWEKDARWDWPGVPPSLWVHMRLLLPVAPRKKRRDKKDRKGGRPRADDRRAFGGILWIARTGASWSRLPPRFGSGRTARRRLALWERTGALENMFGSYLSRAPDEEVRRWADVFRFRVRGPTETYGWRDLLEWTYKGMPRAEALTGDAPWARAAEPR